MHIPNEWKVCTNCTENKMSPVILNNVDKVDEKSV